jgi:hypothetical protein
MFAGKAGAYPRVEHLKDDKRSSLLWKVITYGRKKSFLALATGVNVEWALFFFTDAASKKACQCLRIKPEPTRVEHPGL